MVKVMAVAESVAAIGVAVKHSDCCCPLNTIEDGLKVNSGETGVTVTGRAVGRLMETVSPGTGTPTSQLAGAGTGSVAEMGTGEDKQMKEKIVKIAYWKTPGRRLLQEADNTEHRFRQRLVKSGTRSLCWRLR